MGCLKALSFVFKYVGLQSAYYADNIGFTPSFICIYLSSTKLCWTALEPSLMLSVVLTQLQCSRI